ncbi:MAG: putative DNA modification/repair radical SAM protein [bacterium]|nr:putative DNA modification/repair radical SAM protein [bacterium]
MEGIRVEYLAQGMSVMDKLNILTDAAKYDVACTSSGVDRKGDGRGMGNTVAGGICHSFAADGRCISLLKILFTNECIYNCKYCINRVTNDVPRASFTPEEICELTMNFYKRNYIEGLFLSSGILKNPTYTMELIYKAIFMLRNVYHFQGYVHVKAIPGADERIIEKLGLIVDRMSINLELPTADGLKEIAPNKTRKMILKPMRQIQTGIVANKNELTLYKHAPKFVPAGQSTQMVIGATPENDYQIVSVAENLYQKFDLRRVFYSAFINVNRDASLPATLEGPPLLREHRLYQADFLLRFYGFRANELLSEDKPNFNTLFDPKCDWALKHLEYFPVEVNRADKHMLLRVPGIGVKSAERIVMARRHAILTFDDLKKMGIVLKRALYFITCSGRMMYRTKIDEDYISRNLLDVKERLPEGISRDGMTYKQVSLFDDVNFGFQNQIVGIG